MATLNHNIRNYGRHNTRAAILLMTGCLLLGLNLDGQYFGRNKPGYRKFNFDVSQTPHFEIYHYLKNDSLVKALSRWSEKWYTMHQQVFRDTFDTKNPIIFYSSHADFQQTNAVSSLIGTGTGGVTEALKEQGYIAGCHLACTNRSYTGT